MAVKLWHWQPKSRICESEHVSLGGSLQNLRIEWQKKYNDREEEKLKEYKKLIYCENIAHDFLNFYFSTFGPLLFLFGGASPCIIAEFQTWDFFLQ